MGRYPQAQDAANFAQSVLAGFGGFHLTPPDWLHMTMLVVGSTERVRRESLTKLLDVASSALADIPAPVATLGNVLYHPEAILLAVEPVGPLRLIRGKIDRATALVIGCDVDEEATSRWIPHMTVGYSTADQPAAPIIAALGGSIPARGLTVEAIMLVVQWGPERQWDWETVGVIPLGSGRANPLR